MSVLSLSPDNKKNNPRKAALESVYSSSSHLNLLNKRKRLGPLDMAQGKSDRYATQRVLSAKAHRVKQLQNQLSDAHYHLQELSNENKMLRALQKKQEIALQRYENSSAELPSVLHSHGEEIRIQTQRYKQVKAQYREVNNKLKERDMQYQQLKDEHTHLLELSKDRHLPDREKLQAQVTELTAKVKQQAETISMLQRRIVLENKNFRHQLQLEINKHKDTRHDLDMAINNADKLTTIIEMKEKMLSTAASRNLKSPTKTSLNLPPPTARTVSKRREQDTYRGDGDRDRDRSTSMDALTKLCETSRNITSVLSEEDSSHSDPRSRYMRCRAGSSSRSTPNTTRKNSKDADDILELAKTVQDGMADLTIFNELNATNSAQDDMQKKIDFMKADLLNKIRNDDSPPPISRKSSFIRRQSTEESIEEELAENTESKEIKEPERPKSRGQEIKETERPKSRGPRGSTVSFYNEVTVEENITTTIAKYNSEEADKSKKENSMLEKKLSGKPVEKYCKEIMHGIERSTKSIDRHMKNLNQSQFQNDKLVEQLSAVDSLNEFVNANGEIPEETLNALNNNFKMLTEQVFNDAPTRQRAISGNKRVRESRSLLNDGMSNQEMLDDLLGKN